MTNLTYSSKKYSDQKVRVDFSVIFPFFMSDNERETLLRAMQDTIATQITKFKTNREDNLIVPDGYAGIEYE